MIARQPGTGLRQRCPHPWPSDPLAPDQPADVLVGDGRVGDHRPAVVEQAPAVLSGLGPLGQRVAHRAFGLALPRRHRLVEQAHDLVEDVDRGLGQQRQQDRVAALRLPAFQRLRGQRRPTVARNRRRSAGSTDRSSVSASSPRRNSSFVDLGLHRGRGRLDRAGAQPPQPGHPDRRIDHQQPVQPGAPLLGEQRARAGRTSPAAPLSRACATRSSTVTGPGRITCAEIKYSHASRNSNVGESCSIARASRNSSSSFNSSDVGARHPRYRATSRR